MKAIPIDSITTFYGTKIDAVNINAFRRTIKEYEGMVK